jgi:hypothetical protein
MAEHKIQSNDGALHLTLHRVPKALGALRRHWAPDALAVSFKLETDEALLIKKSARAIADHGVHVVVANELHSRKDVVYLVAPKQGSGGVESTSNGEVRDDGNDMHVEVTKVMRPEDDPVIENVLVERIVAAHQRHMAAAGAQGGGV